ncbi:39S ribosomal protein L44, mitochondrial-like [Centruroides sculpturatus]|uniref:39S ribosomal protein L44, mitochondrial-like n=1 Tax=Centruroides sculpturatus TaxID=218467 RepID=UPI000C6E9F2C|nr:39S ribosomal protein L44, mitochondrial-like [Centruroides sculpturatus]
MAMCRIVNTNLKLLSSCIKKFYFQPVRNFRNWEIAKMMIMKKRRKIAGPPPVVPRSMWPTWNRTSEIFAFGKRLNEEFKEETLETVFTHQSYITKEEKKRENLEVSMQDLALKLVDNSVLISEGTAIMTRYIMAYLRHVFPFLPEEGICAIHDYLMSDDILSHVSFNIGTEELILCEEEPPSKSTLANTLKAIIGAIQRDQIHLTHLKVYDKSVIITIRPLLWKAGTNTIFAVYHVGIYCDKVLLGKGPGETIKEAVDVAARDALNKIFHITPGSFSLPFGDKGHKLELDKEKINVPLLEWTSTSVKDNTKISYS